ncbi:MAG: site-2 protease family protein [Actinomycetota bacterium]
MALIGVLAFALVIMFMIAFHEAGHFATAKLFGMRVDRYFLGFGPTIWSRQKGETEYGIKAFPIGGFVKIAGMGTFEKVPPEEEARTFQGKPAWQRAIVLVAGSATHYVLAFILLAAILMAFGEELPTTRIGSVGDGTPAAAAGLQAGDRVVGVGGKATTEWSVVRSYIKAHPGRSVEFLVQRSGKTVTLVATPDSLREDGKTVGYLGVVASTVNHRYGLVSSVPRSADVVGVLTVDSLRGIRDVFGPSGIGRLWHHLSGGDTGDREAAGIVGAGRLAGEAAAAGEFAALLAMLASLSIFVAIINLAPLPPLDGGHLAVLLTQSAVNGVRRLAGKPADFEVRVEWLTPVAALVVALLVTLSVALLYLDLAKPITNPFAPG